MIVILTNIPTPYRTAFFNELSIILNKKEIGFHVLYCAATEPRRFWEFAPRANNYNYTFLKGFHPVFNGMYPHINLEVLSQLKRLNPKSVICAGAWNTPTVLFALYLSSQKFAAIFWSEGHADAQRSQNGIINYMRSKVFKRFDGFLVPNQQSKNYVQTLAQIDETLIGQLPNTVDEEFFKVDHCRSLKELRSIYNFKSDDRIILMISTLSPRKGVLEFVNGYSKFIEQTNARDYLIILGTGDLEFEIKELIARKKLKTIFLLGHVSEVLVRDYLYLSDIFALPTKLDPNPLTPIEASFMKTPLLLSRKAGNFNELLFENTGIAIEEVSADSIFDSLLDYSLLSKSQLMHMGEMAYKNVKKNFTRKNASMNLVKFLQQKKFID